MPGKAVLVLENVHQALPVVRSLGRAGIHVILGVSEGGAPAAGWSRYVSERWHHPALDDFPRFADALKEMLQQRGEIIAVFPCGEFFRKQAIEHGLELKVLVVGAQTSIFLTCRDKLQANALAKSAGLEVPATQLVSSIEDLKAAADEIGYPVLVKPYGDKQNLEGNKTAVLSSAVAFEDVFPVWPSGHASLLVQSYISGAVESADFVAHKGRLVGYCEATSVRTDNPDGTGFGVMFKSHAPSEDLLQATRRFTEICSYDGAGIIQFIRCATSGRLYFLENNPRLSAGVATSTHWGQDIPRLAIEAAVPALINHHTPSFDANVAPYQFESLCYWFERDIVAYMSRRKGLTSKQRRRWRADICRSLWKTDYHVVWQSKDPLPSMFLFGGLLLRKIRRLLGVA